MSGFGPGPVDAAGRPPAGWYDDPDGVGLRWWDGTAWTAHQAQAGAAGPQPVGYAPVRPRNRFATAGLVLGVVAVVVNPGAVVSVVGLVLSAVGVSRANRMAEHGYAPVGRAAAMWGLVLSMLALLLTGVFKSFVF